MKKNNEPDKIETMRHSTAHVLAAAVQKLWPEAKFGIGPAIENGFYYDIEFTEEISKEDLPKIEKEMEKIKKEAHPFEREEISVEEARELFKDDPYKLELIDEIARGERPPSSKQKGPGDSSKPGFKDQSQSPAFSSPGPEKVSIYRTGDFVDLCRGPHVENTSQIGAFKLHKLAGAYWKGNENNPMLTRIYGLAFETEKELQNHLEMLKKAEKRDHRKIGKELDLFSFHPAAPGDAFWHPKGWTVFKELMRYWREIHRREGYVEVRTPVILKKETWEKSGHTDNYLHKMYRVLTPEADEWNMAVKPMNCDGGMIIYNERPRSYKDFPLRMGELGVVHRYESSGETTGLLRAREFTQDDAHIYCTPKQIKKELKGVIDLCFEFYDTFGLELDHLELSTRPENSIGSDEVWERAEKIMRGVLTEKNVPHEINEGDGAFYGPKFDFHLRDTLGRTWQCATIQLDFAQPENFDLEYTTEEGTKERPVMIHRVVYGSIERFLGILIENCTGNFPVWLAPVQAVIIPVSEKQNDYAEKVREDVAARLAKPCTGTGVPNVELPPRGTAVPTKKEAATRGVATKTRVEIDQSDQTLQKKIRNAELAKIPYMLIVGSREEEAGDEVSLRLRSEGDVGTVKVKDFAKRLQEKILTRSLEL